MIHLHNFAAFIGNNCAAFVDLIKDEL